MHGIPHLVWWNRGEQRLVEYGSSFAALRASGLVQGLRDTVVNLNERHLLRSAETVYEALEGAGLDDRGDQHHDLPRAATGTSRRSRASRPSTGPKRFFFYSVYESDRTGAPIAWLQPLARARSTRYAASIGRWLVTRDGFDLLVHYLPDYDYASHALGPDAAHEALARADDAIDALFDAAGGRDAFLERYARRPLLRPRPVARSSARRGSRSRARSSPPRTAPRCSTATTRARLAEALDGEPSVDVALFLEDGEVVARRDGDEDLCASSTTTPTAARAPQAALRNPNSGEVLVSAAPGWEFDDLAGRHHLGGGSHGALADADSLVPMLTVGPRRAAGVDHRDQGPPPRALRDRAWPKQLPDAMAARPAWIERQLVRARDPRRARARGDGARAARALRPAGRATTRPTRTARSRSRTDRRSLSRTWWR